MFAGGTIKKEKRANEVNKQNPQAETKFIASEVSWHVWNQFQPRNTFIVLIVLHSGTKRHDTAAGARESPPFINQSLFKNAISKSSSRVSMNIIGFLLLRSSFFGHGSCMKSAKQSSN